MIVKDVTLDPSPTQPPTLLDQLRRCIRDNHSRVRTERTYVYWARWYSRFDGPCYPMDMGLREIQAFMSYLVNERSVAGATYTQALCALLFLYRKVLQIELPWIEGISRPGKAPRRPTVLASQEIDLVLGQMEGV